MCCVLRRAAARLGSILVAILVVACLALIGAAPALADARIVIVMVWDGLRPDAVTRQWTPNLYALMHQGVFFANHHSVYPSLTMVNAAALATAAPPGANGIVANSMYFAPLLGGGSADASAALMRVRTRPVSLENPQNLAALSGAEGLNGNLVTIPTIAQQLLRKGGFAGIVGKTGPTFTFDDRMETPDRAENADEIFVSDDRIFPPSLAPQLPPPLDQAGFAAGVKEAPPLGDQDRRLTDSFVDRVLPAAAASRRPALLILWQHNPDITEHQDGLGTADFARALAVCDANLGRLRQAIARLRIEGRTDLIVVSDHGFATIKARVELAGLLVAQGLKRSPDSDDVVIAHNFGSDELYLSNHSDGASRTALARRIVEYAAAQPWCGPIFSRAAADGAGGYAGAIAGTFNQAWFGLLNPARSADLVISFREFADQDNARLGGPQAPAVVLSGSGVHSERNRSEPVLHPMMGVAYADSNPRATTGAGTHGSLGQYEMHNFGAAIGPDFRAGWVDRAPSSNIDIGRTVGQLLAIPYTAPAGQPLSVTGRILKEALRGGAAPAHFSRAPLAVTLNLPGRRIVTTIEADRIEGKVYPITATVKETVTR